MPAFSEWESFYVIVGSSAGALIGLQFVVITLIADMPIMRDMKRASSAFSTPNIVHFCSVLLLSAFVAAPWHGFEVVEDLWGALGLAGMIYALIVARRMRVQTAYMPEFEDWLFHALLPFVAYATLLGSAFASRSYLEDALFGVGAAALLLLFIGIHNAWDAVTYHVTVVKQRSTKDKSK
jgi:hypothetical protein